MKLKLRLLQATDGRELLVWKPAASTRIWKEQDGYMIYSPGLPIHPELGYCYPLAGEFYPGQIITHLEPLPPGSVKSGVREKEPGITFDLGDWNYITIEPVGANALDIKNSITDILRRLVILRSDRYVPTEHLPDFALCLALLSSSGDMTSEDYCSINTLASLAYMGTPILRSRVTGLDSSPVLSDQAQAWLKAIGLGQVPSNVSFTNDDIEVLKAQILRDNSLESLLAGYAFCALCPSAPEMVTEFGVLPDVLAELRADLVVSDQVSESKLLGILNKYVS